MANVKELLAGIHKYIRESILERSVVKEAVTRVKERTAEYAVARVEQPAARDEVRRAGIRIIKEHRAALDWLADK